MDENTLYQIKTWLFENRERFTSLISNDIEIQNLPQNLIPKSIDFEILQAYLNFSTDETIFKLHKHDGFHLYSMYTHLFQFIGIEFNSVYQCKLFLYFYRLSYHYAPSQEEWNRIINDNVSRSSIIDEATNQILN
jgi:hypothetical protein